MPFPQLDRLPLVAPASPFRAALARALFGLTLLATCAGGLFTATRAAAQEPLPDTRVALEEPDRFNWLVFLELCKKAPADLQTTVTPSPQGPAVQTNNALWETWATDGDTFPQHPDPTHPPTWRGRLITKLFVTHGGGASGLERMRAHRAHLRVRSAAPAESEDPNLVVVGVGSNGSGTAEEVRRNQVAFDYIVDHQLYYTEGLAQAWHDRVDAKGYLTGSPVSFPRDAIEIKADWASFAQNPELTKENCHWNYDETGQLWGLIGLHIMTKALPNWTWATFEWVDNPTKSWEKVGAVGRSDWIGTTDTFGYSYPDGQGHYGSFQAPVFLDPNFNLQPSKQKYPPGKISPALEALFNCWCCDDAWRQQWQHYRLKGSQVDFVDTHGRPTLLGNSSTEAEVLFTDNGIRNSDLTRSSCITCHAGASTTSTGGTDFVDLDFVIGPPNPRLYFKGVNSVGPLDYSPYRFARTPNMAQRDGGYQVNNIPMDFVWAFLNANPAGQSPQGPKY